MTSTPVHKADPEKWSGLSFADIGGHHQHLSHAREKLRHFLHPDGKRIHIADSPQDAEKLRRQLTHLKDDDFDIYISGSAEHLEALRKAHEHHEGRRDQLREEHGDMYQRFADVHYELDALSHELERVTSHGVSLEAHFSKWGYNAHIRTYDDESSPGRSGTTTPKSTTSSEKSSDAKCEKGYGKPLKLFKVPVLRQYFHKGTLWRSADAEEVQSFELFVDLLYVGIIAVNGDATSEHPTGKSLLQFVITFTLSWKIWNDMTLVVSWFETDDLVQRVSMIMLLAFLFGYTTNITHAFEGTYATLIGFYLSARLFMGSYLLLVAILVPMVRSIMIWYVFLTVVAVGLWIGSIHVSYPNRLALIFIALVIELAGQIVYLVTSGILIRMGGKVKEWVEKTFQFWPAINIEHRTERMNAFVTLVFGYSVVALLYQTTRNGIDAHYGKAVLGLVQAFCFNWMYFEVDGSNLQVHAIRRHKISAFAWTFTHLPFIMAYVLGGAGLSRLVLAVDTKDSHLDYLTPQYRDRAEEEILQGIRWFYCAGFAIALIFMGFISISHVHKESLTLRLRKRWRLFGRFSVAIILVCLPLAESLNSLQLVGIVTALIVFALGLELWCGSCSKSKLCQRSQPCKYYGHCGKKDLEALIKEGKEVDVAQLSSDKTKNSGLTMLH